MPSYAKRIQSKRGKVEGDIIEIDWREYYGIAVADLGLLPSEVRKMTIGEIQSIIWAKTRTQDEEISNEDLSKLLKEAKQNAKQHH